MFYSCSNFLCLSLSVFLLGYIGIPKGDVTYAATSDIRFHRLDQRSLYFSLSLSVLRIATTSITRNGTWILRFFFLVSSPPAAEDDVSAPAPPAQPGLPPSQPAAASLLLRIVKRANQNESQQESGKKLGRNNNLSRLKILYEDWLLVICVSLFYKPTAKEKRRTIDLRSSPKFDRPSSEGAQCFLEL